VLDVEKSARDFNDKIFKPEAEQPLKTLELPVGGSVSPVDALGLLVEFLTIAGTREGDGKSVEKYSDDDSGTETIQVLNNSFQVLNRIAGNKPESLGLHPAVYFYNEKGKYSRFLFLGMVAVIQDKLRNNNSEFFKRFTAVRKNLEEFLLKNKSVIGQIVVNLSKRQRVSTVRKLLENLVRELQENTDLKIENVVAALGIRGPIVAPSVIQMSAVITDETKSVAYLRKALENALHCPVCGGILDPSKSVSYDHIKPKRDGGTGDITNVQLAHPYCNSGYKESIAAAAEKAP
jgi:hypothetical protein